MPQQLCSAWLGSDQSQPRPSQANIIIGRKFRISNQHWKSDTVELKLSKGKRSVSWYWSLWHGVTIKMSSTRVEQLVMIAMLTLAGTGTCFFLPNINKSVESDCLSQDNKPGVCTKITNCQTLGSNIILYHYNLAFSSIYPPLILCM